MNHLLRELAPISAAASRNTSATTSYASNNTRSIASEINGRLA